MGFTGELVAVSGGTGWGTGWGPGTLNRFGERRGEDDLELTSCRLEATREGFRGSQSHDAEEAPEVEASRTQVSDLYWRATAVWDKRGLETWRHGGGRVKAGEGGRGGFR